MIKFYGNAQDLDGNALSDAVVLIKSAITGVNAPIFEDDGATPKANPTTSDASGRYSFKIDAGLYDITATKSGFTVEDNGVTVIDDPSLLYLQNDEGASLEYGDPVYISGDGEVKLAESNGTEAEAGVVAVCVEDLLTDGSVGRFRTMGAILRAGTPGAIGYLSASGTITETEPVVGSVVVLGRQISATEFLLLTNVPSAI